MTEFTVPEWVPVALRYGIIGLVAPPAVGKFLTYTRSVEFFASLGIPFPEHTVLVVGALQLAAVVSLLVNVARWVAAIALIPIMLVAFWTTQEWQALAVLLGAIGLLAIELGILVVDTEEPHPETTEDDGARTHEL